MNMNDFNGRLISGEKIIWSGAPVQGLIFTARDLSLVPFSLFFFGFAIFWESSVVREAAPGFFKLWGAPFLLVGLYMFAGRFLVDAWIRRGILYAVTNRRILIFRPKPFSSFVAINLDRLPEVRLSESSGDRGTIRFGQETPIWGRNNLAGWTPSLDPTPQFIGIEDAKSVFDKIQRINPVTN